MDDSDKGYTEDGLYFHGVHASKLWPNSPLMGGATRRQLQAIIDNPEKRDAAGKTMVQDYRDRVRQSDEAWAQLGIETNPNKGNFR